MKKKILITLAAAAACTLGITFGSATEVKAAEVGCTVTSTTGTETNLRDDAVTTTSKFNSGDTITIKAEGEVDSVYIKFDYDPGKWTLGVNGKTYEYGGYGILHEFETLPEKASTFTITFNQDDVKVCDIWTFNGETPDWVQKWEKPCDKADILVCNTHADDEILFLGTALLNYADKAAVQPCMLTHFYDSTPIRTHEYYNALWYCGITHAPIIGPFYDNYSESLEHAKGLYDYNEVLGFVTEQIRRFKPQVIVGHDVNGEYGHGVHMLYTAVIKEVIEKTGDASYFPESANTYGTWTPLKTYLHVYDQNQIVLDTRTPLERYGGKTGIEVLREAYKQHASQQYCWYYVEDGIDEPAYKYSVAKFGLYKSLVGEDVLKNDLLENITTYADQAKAEEESKKTEESKDVIGKDDDDAKSNIPFVIIVIVIIVVIVILIALLVRAKNAKKRRRRRKNRNSNSNSNSNRNSNRNNYSNSNKSHDRDRRNSRR